MPASDAASLVARFLKSNNYNETLDAFIREAGLDEDAGSTNPGDWTIEQILREKQQFDMSLLYEKKDEKTAQGWTTKAPTRCHEPQMLTASNVLCVYGHEEQNEILSTYADKSLQYRAGQEPFALIDNGSYISDSPILSIQKAGDLILTTSMSGHLRIQDQKSHRVVDECRNHSKYAVQVASFKEGDLWVIATAGWDSKIQFYAPETNDSKVSIGSILHTQTLPTNPESMVFIRHPDSQELYLIATRRDSTHLHYYKVSTAPSSKIVVTEGGRQNLAPHSNAWVAFTPCSLAQCPQDPTLVAVATSHIPHMKLIIVRLLFPEPEATPSEPLHLDQASAARAELARQDREDRAIKLHVTTMAPQTPYSTPQVVWRPDASGLYVNGDDGVIRGVEASSGKIVAFLRGHEVGSKVRTLWCGQFKPFEDGDSGEILISGGFDKKLLIWTS